MSTPVSGPSSLWVKLGPREWVLQNHRLNPYDRAQRVRTLKHRAYLLAREHLRPVAGPVAILARAYPQRGPLPDADAIAPTVKAVLDGIVAAGIIPDDTGEHVPLVAYGAPRVHRAQDKRGHHIHIQLTPDIPDF